jgi:hypothetical protein
MERLHSQPLTAALASLVAVHRVCKGPAEYTIAR